MDIRSPTSIRKRFSAPGYTNVFKYLGSYPRSVLNVWGSTTLLTGREANYDELDRRHQATRTWLFGQKEFQRRFTSHKPFGLCAGLVQVWWAELCQGNDAIASLHNATRSLITDVLLAQARSIYFKKFPTADKELSATERILLMFKYGSASLTEIAALQNIFDAENAFELDLVLYHDQPLRKRNLFLSSALDVVRAVTDDPGPNLHVIISRYPHPRRIGIETGHRCALAVGSGGWCRFYDPHRGETSFSSVAHFTGWFPDYWKLERWDRKFKVGAFSSAPVQLFSLGGSFSPSAEEKRIAVKKKILSSTRFLVDLELHLDEYSAEWIAATITECGLVRHSPSSS